MQNKEQGNVRDKSKPPRRSNNQTEDHTRIRTTLNSLQLSPFVHSLYFLNFPCSTWISPYVLLNHMVTYDTHHSMVMDFQCLRGLVGRPSVPCSHLHVTA